MRRTIIVQAPLLLVPLLMLTPVHATAQPVPDEPVLEESPDACAYLTEGAARTFLGVERVGAGRGNEHIPVIWSQCTYGGPEGRSVGFVFKFMVWDLFDTESLHPLQLDFHAQFSGAGVPPSETLAEPGKITFQFEDEDRTTVMMVTGIQGPTVAGGPSELVATYHLERPDMPHAEKIQLLVGVARDHLTDWLAAAERGSAGSSALLRLRPPA